MRALAACFAVLMSFALAQQTVGGSVRDDVTYVDASSLAVALGDVVTAYGETLTWRGSEGVATFFAGSSVALLQRPGDGGPTEWPLSAAVVREAGPAAARVAPGTPPGGASAASGWLLPLDAVQLLGVAAEETANGVVLHAPDGAPLRLVFTRPAPPLAQANAGGGAGWEVTELGAARGLRFFAGDKSLLLLDLDLLPLAYPAATEAVDRAAARAGTDNALLLIATALTAGELDTSIGFAQEGRELAVRSPYRVHVYRGDPAELSPANEVMAVVLLPATFSLYRPLTVTWAGTTATITFRR